MVGQTGTRTERTGRRRLAVGLGAAAAVVLLAALASSCRTNGGDLMGNGVFALEGTAAQAVDASGAIATGLDRFMAIFSDFTPAAVRGAAADAYADDAYFNDGFAELNGATSIAAYFERTAGSTATIDVDIEDQVVSGSEVYLRWVMTFTTSGRRGKTVVAPGMTHLRIDRDGRIVYHRDYWDASGALAEFVPLMSSILRSVRSRLEAE
jgi:steroid delta-isomerase